MNTGNQEIFFLNLRTTNISKTDPCSLKFQNILIDQIKKKWDVKEHLGWENVKQGSKESEQIYQG